MEEIQNIAGCCCSIFAWFQAFNVFRGPAAKK